MAIDTQNKRRAVSNFLFCVLAPVPDGSVDTSDRMQISFLYPGISSSAAETSDPVRSFLIKAYNFTHTIKTKSYVHTVKEW